MEFERKGAAHLVDTIDSVHMASKQVSRLAHWTVVGAGPAGIATVGKLIDLGVDPSCIVWIDPRFDAGLLGRSWRSVHSNTTVALFERFLFACDSFGYGSARERFALHSLPSNGTCELRYVVEPLLYITQKLQERVQVIRSKVERLVLLEEKWLLETRLCSIYSTKVVLAIGSKPKELSLGVKIPVIPLEKALQIHSLSQECQVSDTVAVFGSSHSAIMIIRDLLSLKVKKVVNFFRKPLLFAQYLDDGGIVHDSTGLKGKTAEWAAENLKPNKMPKNLIRVFSKEESIDTFLNDCTKVIYAVGFERQELCVEGISGILFDDQTGKISRFLYGVGIAFPELAPDAAGNLEYQVGLWKFMKFLERILPLWLADS